MAEEDTEITLGMGKLLGLFFMLALTCGIFFAVGYSLGKTAEREQALKNQPAQTLPADPDVANSKPSALPPEGNASPAADNSKETAPDLTFYKAVKQNPGEETKPAEELKSSPTTTTAAASNTVATRPHEIPVRPWEQEDGLHIEDHKQDGDDVEAHRIAAARIIERGDATFVGHQLGFEGIFRTHQRGDQQRAGTDEKCNKSEDENRYVILRHEGKPAIRLS